MPATLTYSPPLQQPPADLTRVDPCDPWSPMNPLAGIWATHRTTYGYREASPDGESLPFRITATHSIVPQPIMNYESCIMHCYTFSAKERDSETGLSYFGSRYYSSDLSIWLSVDPQASKYPSLSPYVYCANNPVRVVDPDGEEIYVGDDYYYRNGYLYYKGTDKVFVPDNDSFEGKALNSLNKLRNTNQGGELIEKFEGNTGKDAIIIDAIYRQGEKNNQSGVDNETIDNETGDFKSATIFWNPEGKSLRTTEGYQQNGTTDLGHEFSHVFDMTDKSVSRNQAPAGAPEGEWRAVYRENMIRYELGLPYRMGYKVAQRHPVTGEVKHTFVKMLNGGCPYLPASLRN